MPSRSHTQTVVRSGDLLVARIDLYNLLPKPGAGGLQLAVVTPGVGATIVLALPPQHIHEPVVPKGHSASEFESGGVMPSRISDITTVAFEVPPGAILPAWRLEPLLEFLTTCRLTVVPASDPPSLPAGCAGVLARLPPLLRPSATPPPGSGLRPPAPWETAIELPFRLVLSPPSTSGFAHQAAVLPGSSLGVTAPAADAAAELWHSRLAVAPGRLGVQDDPARSVRAVWLRQGDGPAWDPNDPTHAATIGTAPGEVRDSPFIGSLRQSDRAQIVHLSANWNLGAFTKTNITPQPARVRMLGVSALGGWLDSTASWDLPEPFILDLESWRHRASLGRDHYVRISQRVYLLPFGHRADLVTISERRVEEAEAPFPAYLHQRTFIVVRQPQLDYPPSSAPTPALGHTMPMSSVRLRTLVTPDLNPLSGTYGWADEAGTAVHFPFHFEATDVAGHIHHFESPLVVVLGSVVTNSSTVQAAIDAYQGDVQSHLDFHGAPLALAPEATAGDTTHQIVTAQWTAVPVDPNAFHAGFYPKLLEVQAKLPALHLITGNDDPTTLRYADRYQKYGLDPQSNPGSLIAQITTSPVPVRFGGHADRSGGLLRPDQNVTGLSRSLGTIAGPPDMLGGGVFDPVAYFGGPGALPNLFGVIPLPGILNLPKAGSSLGNAPQLVSHRVGDALVATLDWQPEVKSYPEGNDAIFVADASTTLRLQAKITATGSSTSSSTTCTLSAFSIHLLPAVADLIHIDVKKIEFSSVSGAKADISVDIGDIVFAGPLSWVNTLRSIIPLQGFVDPPALDISASGIQASFSLALPSLAVGMFTLQNLSLGAGFLVPFDDRALAVTFDFCAREQPFLLTVSALGGGGFFGLTLDPKGIQVLEAAFEFGASVAIDFGVASGGVHIMAGIYFRMESTGVTLSGYFRLGGEVSVLDLISASIELKLSLTYESASGKVVGRATLTIEIDIFLFSASVEISCERKFAGSASDPTFVELMAPFPDPGLGPVDPWNDYCQAYA